MQPRPGPPEPFPVLGAWGIAGAEIFEDQAGVIEVQHLWDVPAAAAQAFQTMGFAHEEVRCRPCRLLYDERDARAEPDASREVDDPAGQRLHAYGFITRPDDPGDGGRQWLDAHVRGACGRHATSSCRRPGPLPR